jgi:amidase
MLRGTGKRRIGLCAFIATVIATMPVASFGQGTAGTHRFDLLTATVSDIQEAVAAGALTYEQLVELYLARIDAYDRRGPKLRAVIEINPQALEIARKLDEERRTSGLRSPLHGIPIAVKDTVDVRDIPSAGGSIALAGTFPAHDATVIRRLREAGAIIFLKTNLDEFNMGAEGLSSLGGQTLNPFDLERNPGGSSAGSAVAVAAGFATLAIGTESGASVRSPASNAALVGIAPSQGLVSRAGVMVISYTQDRVGPIAGTVADAALLLSVMRGFDAADLFTWESLGRVEDRPYTDFLDDDALAGARLGVLRDMFRKGEEFAYVNELIERELDRLRGPVDEAVDVMPGAGAVIVDGLGLGMDLIGFFPEARASIPEIQVSFDAWLRQRGPDTPIASFAELVRSGDYLPSLEPLFSRVLELEPPQHNANYLARLRNREVIRQALVRLLNEHQLDALVYPFKSLGAPPLGTPDRGPRDNPISSITGLPAIVVPAGTDADGLPVAIEFLGRPFSEPQLIALAHAYELRRQGRITPPGTPPLEGDRFSY